MLATNSYKKLHKVLSVSGFVLLLLWAGLFLYEEEHYERGFSLHLMRELGFQLFLLAIALYFILSFYWHRSRYKQALFGVIALMAIADAVVLIAIATEWIKEIQQQKTVGYKMMDNLFSGLFRSSNPPPAWMRTMNDFLPLLILIMILPCFLLLLRFRKQWMKPPA